MKTTIRIIGLLVLFISVGYLLRRNQDWVRSIFEPEDISAAIRGNVRNPGIYRLKQGDTLEDLLQIAGGYKKPSQTKQDLSREILDGQIIELKE
jgi:protein involved in polysaccharide export with SLBB domain